MDYPLLTPATVAAYIATRHELSAIVDPATVEADEIGDGNLNLIFLCRDARGSSLVLKQSLPYVRMVGPSWPLTPDRSTSEWIGLTNAQLVSPTTSPKVYGYDEDQHVVAMEDLSRLVVWRTALDSGDMAQGADDLCGRHIARVAFATSTLGQSADNLRRAVARATNPELCRITEDLVFTEPLIDHEHNSFSRAIASDVAALREDPQVRTEVARLKAEFITRTEALIHGDLHTGSVMVGSGDSNIEARVIDAEFCCYGPIAFDVGMLIANMLFAHARAAVLQRPAQAEWLARTPAVIWSAFNDEWWALWPQRVDPHVDDDAAGARLGRIERDAIGFAGCEAIRRIVGLAKVSDIETLTRDQHTEAASEVLRIAHRWLVDPSTQLGSGFFDRE